MRKMMFVLASSVVISAPILAMPMGQASSVTMEANKIENNKINKDVISLNGNPVEVAGDLIKIKDQTLFPLRSLAKAMGATNIQWNNETKTATIEIPAYSEAHRYLSYLNGITNSKEDKDYSLPKRVKDLQLPPYPLKGGNSSMFEKTPITITIQDDGFSADFAAYDYVIKDNKLYVTGDWFNTMFLADIKMDKDAVDITYPTQVQIEEKLSVIEDVLAPTTPEETLSLWVRGQQVRSGALQYSSLSPKLKEQVLAKKEGWVTGGSSPSAGNVTIVKTQPVGEDTMTYVIKIDEMLQGKVSGQVTQNLEIKKYNLGGKTYWLIEKATGDLGFFSVLRDNQ